MPSEADARIVIDRLLREAGWEVENPAVVSTEEAAADGRADYLLKSRQTRPLCVIESKRFSVDPYSAKEQARAYAVGLNAPFVILSNGREHYFWEYSTGDARPVLGFPLPEDLERRANMRLHRHADPEASLATIPLPNRAEQHRIVSRLDALAAKQAELHRLQTETKDELSAFTPALLAKAFRGEL